VTGHIVPKYVSRDVEIRCSCQLGFLPRVNQTVNRVGKLSGTILSDGQSQIAVASPSYGLLSQKLKGKIQDRIVNINPQNRTIGENDETWYIMVFRFL
jgi:hypothetical protein